MGRKLNELRVPDLKAELEKRSLDTTGVKKVLVIRLQEALEKEGQDPGSFLFEDLPEIPEEEEASGKIEKPAGESITMERLMEALMQLNKNSAELNKKIDSNSAELNRKMDFNSAELNKNSAELNKKIDFNSAEQNKNSAELNRKMDLTVLKVSELENSMEKKLEEVKINIESSMEIRIKEVENSVETKILEVRADVEGVRTDMESVRTDMESVRTGVEISVERVQTNLEKLQVDLERVKARQSTASPDSTGPRRIQPPTFDGQTAWSTYKLQFEAAAEANFWTDEEKATTLVLSLRGPAAELLQTIPEESRKNYATLVQTIELRYGIKHMQEVHRLQLRNRMQKPGETLQQLCADIERLTHLAYPNFGQDYITEVAREAFINSLVDRELQQAVRLAGKTSTAEVLAFALSFEAARQASRNTVRIRELTTECACKRIETSRARSLLRCWQCNQPGHLQRDCRKRRRMEEEEEENKNKEQDSQCRWCRERERKEQRDNRGASSSTYKQHQGNE